MTKKERDDFKAICQDYIDNRYICINTEITIKEIAQFHKENTDEVIGATVFLRLKPKVLFDLLDDLDPFDNLEILEEQLKHIKALEKQNKELTETLDATNILLKTILTMKGAKL